MNIRAFGLTVDSSGAIKAIKDVTQSGLDMAREGAKSAQLYADAFREKLNQVARQYIPETMRAIDALRERQRVLASAPTAGIPGLLSAEEVSRSAAAYDQMIAKMKGVEDVAEPADVALGRLRQSFTSLAAQATGTSPVMDRVLTTLASFGIGNVVVIGVVAGLAAIGAAYRALTSDARQAAEEQDKAIESLRRLNRERAAGVGGSLAVQQQQAEAKLAQLAADLQAQNAKVSSFAPNTEGRRIAEQVAADLQKQYDDVAAVVAGGAQHLVQVRNDAAKSQADQQVHELAQVIAAHKATAAEIRNAQLLITGFQQSLNALSGDSSKTAERARLIEQIRELNDALHPPKELRAEEAEAARIAAENQRIADAAANALNQRNIAAVRSIETMRAENAQARAMVEATTQGKEAVGALTIAQAGENAVRAAGAGISDRLAAAIRKEAEERARLAIQLRDLQAADKSTNKDAARDAAEVMRAMERQQEATLRVMHDRFRSFFADVFESGKSVFQSLWDTIKRGFFDMLEEMFARKATQKLAGWFVDNVAGMLKPAVMSAIGMLTPAVAAALPPGGLNAIADASNTGGGMLGTAAKFGGAGLAGFGLGYSTQSTATGVLGGAAAGFAIAGPLGAATGALSGFVGGLLGANNAAKEAAARLTELWNAAGKAAAQFHEQTLNRDSFETAKAQIDKDFQALWSQLLAGNGGKLPAGLHDVPDDLRTAQTRANVFQQAINDYNTLIEKAKEAAALQLKQTSEDLRVRLLTAEGRDKEAAALKLQIDQEREREALINSFGDSQDETEKATLALLDQVQAQEKLKAATDAANKSALNMVEGYNLQRLVFQNASPFTVPNTVTTGGGGFTPTTRTDPTGGMSVPSQPVYANVTLLLDGKVLARVTKEAFKDDGQQQFNNPMRWGETK